MSLSNLFSLQALIEIRFYITQYVPCVKGKEKKKKKTQPRNSHCKNKKPKLYVSQWFWPSRQYLASETLLTIKMQVEFAKVIKLERWELIKFCQ